MLTRLVAVMQAGYIRDPVTLTYTTKSLPPVELGYSLPQIRTLVQKLDPAGARDLAGALQGDHQWVDLDGEALPGVLVRQGDALFYKRNEGGGLLGPARPLLTKPSLSAGGLQVTDIDNDGRKEMIFLERPMAGYYERTEEGSWGPFRAFPAQANIDWSDPSLQLVDLNGDGIDDVLLARGGTMIWFPSREKGGFHTPITLPTPRDDRRPAPIFARDPRIAVLFADMTGDGLADLVRIQNGNVCYWPNLGHGRFGAKVQMTTLGWFDHFDQFDTRRIRFVDVDGSGTSDVLYIHRDGVRIYANQAGNALAAPVQLPRLPDQSPLSVPGARGGAGRELRSREPCPVGVGVQVSSRLL